MAGLIDLKKLQSIIQRTPEEKNLPKHLILNLFPLNSQEENKKEEFNKLLDIFFEMMDLQKEKNIPIMTISLGGKEDIDENVLFEKTKLILKKANEYRMKVSVFGRWYDLRGQLVEELKRLNSETDGFDNFFLNICINYDPKQEIADASRVIIRKILMEKLDIDSGADFSDIIKKSNIGKDEAKKLIEELLKEGEIFELKPGRLKLIN